MPSNAASRAAPAYTISISPTRATSRSRFFVANRTASKATCWLRTRRTNEARPRRKEILMSSKQPAPGELESIETASRDEIAALQLQRMRWSLKHAYDNVPHYRRAFDAAGVRPDDCRTLADLGRFPFTVK